MYGRINISIAVQQWQRHIFKILLLINANIRSICLTYLRNCISTYRLKSTEDSGDEETQSKNNQKVEKGLLVSI